MKFK